MILIRWGGIHFWLSIILIPPARQYLANCGCGCMDYSEGEWWGGIQTLVESLMKDSL